MNVLEQGLLELGIDFDSSVLDGFSKFYSFLLEENQKYNLTKITDRENFDIYHLLDSLLPYKLITGNTLCDVGSGGGFPSLPLKLVRDDLSFTLVESVGKKCEFLRQAVDNLGLSRVRVIGDRAETLARDADFRETFDAATARAVAPLNVLCEYCLPFVRVGGKMIAYKGEADETKEAARAVTLLGGKTEDVLRIETDWGTRHLIIIRKVAHTPAAYPRGNGKERKKPL